MEAIYDLSNKLQRNKRSTPHSFLQRQVASSNQTQPKKTNTQTVQKRRVFFPGCCAQIISSTVAAFQQVAIGVHHQEHERLSHPLPRTTSPHSISQSHTAPRSFSSLNSNPPQSSSMKKHNLIEKHRLENRY